MTSLRDQLRASNARYQAVHQANDLREAEAARARNQAVLGQLFSDMREFFVKGIEAGRASKELVFYVGSCTGAPWNASPNTALAYALMCEANAERQSLGARAAYNAPQCLNQRYLRQYEPFFHWASGESLILGWDYVYGQPEGYWTVTVKA